MKLLEEYSPPALILIAFLCGVAAALGAWGGWLLVWWLITTTNR